MSDPTPENDLEALFARQRAVDQENAPAFHSVRTRGLEVRTDVPPAAAIPWRWAATAALSLAIAGVVLLHHHATPPPPRLAAAVQEIDQLETTLQKSLAAQEALTAWQSPTDFLLNPTHNQNNIR